jgi:hypothetical protein
MTIDNDIRTVGLLLRYSTFTAEDDGDVESEDEVRVMVMLD